MADDARALVQVACPQCDGLNRLPRERLHDHPRCGRCKQELFAGHPVRLTEDNFDAHVVRGSLPVVVDFWAAWCGPCQAMAPVFEQAAQVLEPGLRLGKLNTEEAARVAGRFGIRSIPTLILFHQGREVARQSGAMPGPALMDWIRTNAP
jgi:thioredoxin 2